VTPARSGPAWLRVVRAGALTTVQDDGRPGLAHLGVPRGGALDPTSHHLANRLVANPEAAAVLETTMDGVALAFATEATLAVTGALATVRLDGREVGWSVPVHARAGQTLHVGPAQRGVRNYVAVAGGVQVPLVLGSASRDLLSGLGPLPLADGDILHVGPAPDRVPAVDLAPYPLPPDHIELLVHPGPRHDWLTAGGRATLESGTWTVSPDSNRIALRLQGPPVDRRPDELASEGLVAGAIEVLGDGQLVVFLADHPTTGGYPVAAVVERSSIGLCAQARPGATVRLRRITS
jgi:biotin-dependent carboxylase-like uncharacterized protein